MLLTGEGHCLNMRELLSYEWIRLSVQYADRILAWPREASLGPAGGTAGTMVVRAVAVFGCPTLIRPPPTGLNRYRA